jgi:hypothetical protein
LGFTYSFTLLQEFLIDFKGVTKGINYGSGKTRKTKQGETA